MANAIGIPSKRRLGGEAALAYMLLMPAVLLMLLFMAYPIFYVFVVSLFKTNKLARIQEFDGFKSTANFWPTRKTGKLSADPSCGLSQAW